MSDTILILLTLSVVSFAGMGIAIYFLAKEDKIEQEDDKD